MNHVGNRNYADGADNGDKGDQVKDNPLLLSRRKPGADLLGLRKYHQLVGV